MTLPVFGVDDTSLAYLFAGLTYTDWTTQIDRWIQQAAGDLAAELQMIGYPIASAFALGLSSPLYLVCQTFIESSVAATLVRTSTHEDPNRAKQLESKMERLRDKIRIQVEGLLGDSYDRADQIGGFRGIATGRRRGNGRRRSLWGKGGCL